MTPRSVALTERVARSVITAGGLGTIVSVSLILIFLVWVAMPLFRGAAVESERALETGPAPGTGLLHVGVEDELLLSWTLDDRGRVTLTRLDTARPSGSLELFPEEELTAASFALADRSVVLGFTDGSLRLGELGFRVDFVDDAEAGDLAKLEPGEIRPLPTGLVERTIQGDLRRTVLESEWEAPIERSTSLVQLLDHSRPPSGLMVAALHEDGALWLHRIRETTNLLTGEATRKLDSVQVPFEVSSGEEPPTRMLLSGIGSDLYLTWDDGRLRHYDLRQFRSPRLIGELDLAEEEGAELTAIAFLVGKTTLVAGDSLGRLRAWFPVREDEGEGEVRLRLVRELAAGSSPVTALSPSARSRLLLAGHRDGTMELFHCTSGAELLDVEASGAPRAVLIAPKENAILAYGERGIDLWNIDRRYPEASFAGLFLPVWYEGAQGPEHVWQSAGGTDEFEPKLGLVPLVFGTLKATLYSMMFGAPLALLAAVFSSEFLGKRWRAPVKALIELMASLPSVVLGFLAALVFAPFVQGVLPEVLACILAMPFVLLLGAHLWQMLPATLAVRFSGSVRFAFVAAAIPLGIAVGAVGGPLLERLLFAGDIKQWLDGTVGSARGGWIYLLLPLSAMVLALAWGRLAAPRMRARSAGWSRARIARSSFFGFAIGTLLAVGLAVVLAQGLTSTGFDPRGSVFGTYVDRNAMIVGFVMGFAIIPIIYTLADDALTEVPSHLREASLGAGATPWQTATRIVVPTAMSGLFSALMIGLGRAVGETMIVLMAAGNTAIMDLNIFNGFRTLSANIATELPEAVRDSTHYRTLFLAALVLFAMTFVLNSLAEAVRRHYRAKTHAL